MKVHPFQIKPGFSHGIDPVNTTSADLVLLFGAPGLMPDENEFQELKSRFPQAVIAGCTSTGEIFQGAFHEESLSGVAISFHSTRCRSIWRQHDAGSWLDAGKMGRGMAAELAAPDLKVVLLFVDGLGLDVDALLSGIHEGFGSSRPLVYGGAAGDYYHFTETSVVCDEGILASGVVAVGLYGENLSYSTAVSDSYTEASDLIRITGAEGNVVKTLNGRPALQEFRASLAQVGMASQAIVDYCLLLETESGEPLVPRSIISKDEASGEMTFVGTVKEGPCRLVDFSDNYDYLHGARRAAESAVRECDAQLGLFISCAGRRAGLGIATSSEMQSAASALPEGLASLGFYSYGEIAYCHGSGKSEHYNQSFCVLLLGD